MTIASPLSLTNGKAPARGRIAKQVAGTENVEVKATIDDAIIRKALKLFGVAPETGDKRFIYFFDTPKLALFNSGTIVRARRAPGGDHDSTIKIRPVDPAQVPTKWQRDSGFKLESDAGETSIVRSASLSRSVAKGVIKAVAAGDKPVSDLFDDVQELFLGEMCKIRYDLDSLALLGPVSALRWKIKHPGLPVAMTAELWTREDKQAMLEVSIRVPAEQAAFAEGGFVAFLAELGATRENAQQAKTRWVLEHYASVAKAKAPSPLKAKAAEAKADVKAKAAAKAKANKPGTPSAGRKKENGLAVAAAPNKVSSE